MSEGKGGQMESMFKGENGIFLNKQEFTEESFGKGILETHTSERMVVKETKATINNVGNETKVFDTTPDVKAKKTVQQKPLVWDNIVIKKHIALELKPAKPSPEEDGISEDVSQESSESRQKNRMERVLFEYFYSKITTIIKTSIEVTYRVFSKRIGFGFISENNRHFKSKIVRMDKSLFFDSKTQKLTQFLAGYHSYSEIYNIWQTTPVEVEGKTIFIFRHFLHWNCLTDDQKKSFKVATIVNVNGKPTVNFVQPVFVDEKYVLIEKTDCIGWFWIVSKFGNLPTRMRSVFEQTRMCSLTCSMSLRGLSLFQKLLLGSFGFEV